MGNETSANTENLKSLSYNKYFDEDSVLKTSENNFKIRISCKQAKKNKTILENIFYYDELQRNKGCKKAPDFMQILPIERLKNLPFSAIGFIKFEDADLFNNENTKYEFTGTFFLKMIDEELIGVTAAHNIYNECNSKVINYETVSIDKHNYNQNIRLYFPNTPNSDEKDSLEIKIDLENIVVCEEYKEHQGDGNEFAVIFFSKEQKDSIKQFGFLELKHQENMNYPQILRLVGFFGNNELPFKLRIQTSEKRMFELMECKTDKKMFQFYT